MNSIRQVLVTGAGGYIGSHAVKRLLQEGYSVVGFDNFSRGYREPLEVLKKYGTIFVEEGDLLDRSRLQQIFQNYAIESIFHFGALCSVDESMKFPELYFQNNVIGSFHLLEMMRIHGIRKIIFSSTCATYGEPKILPVDETHAQNPVNPYGVSKKMTEEMLQWYGSIHKISYAILRYFNVCGADRDGEIGDSKKPSLLLMQNAVRSAMGLQEFSLTCPVVDTPDQTPIRDYVDVEDLVDAHIKALKYLENKQESVIVNLGNGKGWSVQEIVAEVEKVFGVMLPRKRGEKRKGEYACVYADITKAKDLLGWSPQKRLSESVESLKKWYEVHPQGWKQ